MKLRTCGQTPFRARGCVGGMQSYQVKFSFKAKESRPLGRDSLHFNYLLKRVFSYLAIIKRVVLLPSDECMFTK